VVKGLILKCSDRSEAECFDRSLFGADVLGRDEVLSIESGDRLFLLNVASDRLIGTFVATAKGAESIVPEAWKGRYPYQVQVTLLGQRRTLEDAKSTLSAIGMDSLRLLEDFEVDALDDLLTSNGHSDLLQISEREVVSVAVLAKKLAAARKARGIVTDRPVLESTTLWDFPTQSYGATPKGNIDIPE
jgi:hypothetical protein